jgi:hypothetical protein
MPLNPHSGKAPDAHLVARSKLTETRKVETQALFFGLRNKETHAAISTRSVFRMLLHMTKVRGLQRMHPVTPCPRDHMFDNGGTLERHRSDPGT